MGAALQPRKTVVGRMSTPMLPNKVIVGGMATLLLACKAIVGLVGKPLLAYKNGQTARGGSHIINELGATPAKYEPLSLISPNRERLDMKKNFRALRISKYFIKFVFLFNKTSRMARINTRKALSPAYRKHKPLRKDVDAFTNELLACLKAVKDIELRQ